MLFSSPSSPNSAACLLLKSDAIIEDVAEELLQARWQGTRSLLVFTEGHHRIPQAIRESLDGLSLPFAEVNPSARDTEEAFYPVFRDLWSAMAWVEATTDPACLATAA